MAIRNVMSRQGRAAALRPVRTSEIISRPVMRQESPSPVKRSAPVTPQSETPSVMPSELFNSDGGTMKAKEVAPESVSDIDPAIQSATMPDFGGLALGRLASGVKTGAMARAVGAPLSKSIKAGVQTAFNPAGIMLAMADDVVPGILAQAPAQRNYSRAISEVDPTGSRGVQETIAKVDENRGTRRVDPENLDRLRSIGFDDYVHADVERSKAKQASRPFSTQIFEAVADPMEKGLKSMFGITEKEDLDRMIARDEGARMAMSDPAGGSGTSAPGGHGRKQTSKTANAFSAYGGRGGRDFGGRDGGGSTGGRGMSDKGGFGTGDKGDREGGGWV